ncbi:hypothetical protein E2C01_023167 [Portunus trituberculatus]|uniref:Uncharacterized protein n=1 Tax=Portunus trituberculatus TaxID=210409 RepID=A0A5B7EAU3_PORTR|nr:hypothetical protein [Portunus trituberculatus]
MMYVYTVLAAAGEATSHCLPCTTGPRVTCGRSKAESTTPGRRRHCAVTPDSAEPPGWLPRESSLRWPAAANRPCLLLHPSPPMPVFGLACAASLRHHHDTLRPARCAAPRFVRLAKTLITAGRVAEGVASTQMVTGTPVFPQWWRRRRRRSGGEHGGHESMGERGERGGRAAAT